MSNSCQIHVKLISNLFQMDLGLAWVHFPKIIKQIEWHGTWLCTSSENHTHASPGGSKGAILTSIMEMYLNFESFGGALMYSPSPKCAKRHVAYDNYRHGKRNHEHRCILSFKGWLTELLKRPVNHKSWLTGFRGFVRIPSTIPTGTSRLDIWIFGLC